MKCIKHIESVPVIGGNATGNVSIAEKVVITGDATLKHIRNELFKRNVITTKHNRWFDEDGEFFATK